MAEFAADMEVFDVVVIGAGAAGLGAAQELRALGCRRVCVLEAGDRIGGRVYEMAVECGNSTQRFAAGAEFVHGEVGNALVPLLGAQGVRTEERQWPNYFFLGKAARHAPADVLMREDPALRAAVDAYEAIDEAAVVAGETLLQYLVRQGVPSRCVDVVDATYANDYGDEASALGAEECQFEQREWSDGEAYLVLEEGKTLSAALAQLAVGVDDVRLDHKVTSIVQDEEEMGGGSSSSSMILTVSTACGRILRARAAIITVPVGVLQRRAIRFAPPLPAAKVAAINGLRVAPAIKLCVALSTPCWPLDWWDTVCADSLFPEFWRSTSSAPYLVTAFVTGGRADRLLAQFDDKALVRLFLGQLDAIFGTAADPRPASAACVGSATHDWATDPLQGGAYTFPSPGCVPLRAALAQPHQALFFAGEATNPKLNPCVNGAIATGRKAANDAHALIQLRHETSSKEDDGAKTPDPAI